MESRFDKFMPFGLTTLDLVTILAAITAFAIVFAVWNAATVARDPMRKRVNALQGRRDDLRAGLVAQPKRSRQINKSNESVDLMRVVVGKLKLLQSEQNKKIVEKLQQAGFRSRDAIVIYLFFKLVLPFLLGIAAIVMVYGLNAFALSPMGKLLTSVGSVIFAVKAPDLFISNAIQKRVTMIRKGLPDGLDLMVICAEAGLTLDAGLQRVARELGTGYPELSDELTLCAIELGFMQERRTALLNLAKRVDLPAMRAVVTTLIQTEKYGTPLASSLRVLSAEFRNERMMKAEEKAARLPAIMTVPLILFIMPTLFVVLLGPATCRIADEFVNR
ncbi:MAG: type II secretion system F family protein [Pseudomonadota bacterium]